jgi:hypothetical protein
MSDVWVMHLGHYVEDGCAVFTDLQEAKDCAARELDAVSINWEAKNNGSKWIGVAECKPLRTTVRHTVYIFRHAVNTPFR